jgi:hypothetical protein
MAQAFAHRAQVVADQHGGHICLSARISADFTAARRSNRRIFAKADYFQVSVKLPKA